MENTNRKVLFLGNGINRAFNGDSWDELLKKLSNDKGAKYGENVPMPLRAILLTKDGVDKAINSNRSCFYGNIIEPLHSELLKKLLCAGFDDIITVNYSYELESAALGKSSVTENKVAGMMKNTQGRAESVYLLHTYNEVTCGETKNRIWHIHGECRKPGSIILGHYLYGNLLGRIRNELDRSGNKYYYYQKQGKSIAFDSWIDSFILGDIYMLGFGMAYSEFDLWWLLNRRKREKAEKGKVFYFSPQDIGDEKAALLKMLDVDIDNHLGFGAPPDRENDQELNQAFYRRFYETAVNDICSRIQG